MEHRRRTDDRGAGALDARDLNDLERFLICRWRLFSPGPATLPARGVPLLATQVEHPAWPLRRAVVESLHERLVVATGLPSPAGPPPVHASPGVAVRFGGRTQVQDPDALTRLRVSP